jgi:transcriptional regulator with XRE-family HTH domain
MYPDDSQKDLAAVLSYMAGRTLSKEEIWKAMSLPRSTYYDQLEKGTLITADNLRRAAANLGINRAELLTRYRLIDPEEVASLAEEIAGLRRPVRFRPSRTEGLGEPVKTAVPVAAKRASVSQLRPRFDAPPL